MPIDAAQDLSLGSLYRMTARIYRHQVEGHTLETIFSRFVEIAGILVSVDRRAASATEAHLILCDSIAWYFNLMSKIGIRSLDSLIFRKYPWVCPYCFRCPHADLHCKTVAEPMDSSRRHQALRQHFRENLSRMPEELDKWCDMFQSIYPRYAHDRAGRSVLGLMEELGELAEAIRVYDRYPEYALGEAADVFSYLAGIVNETTSHMGARTGWPLLHTS